MAFVALVAFLKVKINSQDLPMSILIHTNTNKYRRRDHLMIYSDIKVYRIGKKIDVIILQLFLLPFFYLGIYSRVILLVVDSE